MTNAVERLLRQKVTIPDRVPGYVHRHDLVERASPLSHRLTVLRAAAGFGKTTLLAECCRSLQRQGIATAWIALDEHDEPKVLDRYIGFACQQAGLKLNDSDMSDKKFDDPNENWTSLIVQQIQLNRKLFVIAFDEIERIRNPESVALLDFLAQRAPPNLHIAFAGREVPSGLNVTSVQMEERGAFLDSEDLRFSEPDVARFFDLKLNHSNLVKEIETSAGWAFALRISRYSKQRRTDSNQEKTSWNVGHWIESRLLSSLTPEDRNFVLDLSLIDRIDTAIVDEVLKRRDTQQRLESLTVLEGLLEPLRVEGRTVWQLHQLVREYCARQRFREDAERFKIVNRRIAVALSKRPSTTVVAMRHAIDGSDPFLAGEILESEGGIRIWTKQGLQELSKANELLTEEVIDQHPRLKLVRCIDLVTHGRPHEAVLLYNECPHPDHVTSNDTAELDYAIENALVRGSMALYGGSPTGSDWLRSFPNNSDLLRKSESVDPKLCGTFEYVRCVAYFLKAEFNIARTLLESAEQLLYGTHYVSFYGNVLRGQIEFVKGLPEEAKLSFQRASRTAKDHFQRDAVAMMSCQVVQLELALECSTNVSTRSLPGFRNALEQHGMPFSLFSTTCNLFIDTRIRSGRLEQSLNIVDDLIGFLRGRGYTIFARLFATLRISALVRCDRVEEAETSWQAEGLPVDALECVDLATRSWREMEAISEARVRLLIASNRFDEGRNLLEVWHSVSKKRELKRTEMRALALSVVLEHRAGKTNQALDRLSDYLEIFDECPYAWSIVRESRDCLPVLKQFLDKKGTSNRQHAAKTLLRSMQQVDQERTHALTQMESAVLARLHGSSDKQIASELEMSVHGVRYHLRGLFSKLQVKNRADAVLRAKERDLIP